MAVTLDQAEIDEFLSKGHTLIFTTVDREGYPHSTPLWYAYLDGHIYTRGRARSQKAANITRNPKVCCLVETGDRWRELKAVMIRGRAEVVTDEETRRRYAQAVTEKYAAFREPAQNMPAATQRHYSTPDAIYKVVPEKKVASWDNRKIRLVQR